MMSQTFTPVKAIFMVVMAIAVWAYLIWQVRGQWVRYRRKREVIAEGGLRPTGGRRDRRNLFLIILVVGMLLAVVFSLYIERYGTPLAQARLDEVKARVDGLMKYLMGVVIALLMLLLILLWWNRDPAVKTAAKLALAGRHAEAEAVIRAQIEGKGPSEQRLTVLGLLLMEQNRLEESLGHLREAQRLAKQPATAKNNTAFVLWKLGRREEAVKLFDEVCNQDPNNFTAVCNSCQTLAELGREAAARERLQQAEAIFARYDFRYTKNWVAQLDACRKAVPPARGFPVIVPVKPSAD